MSRALFVSDIHIASPDDPKYGLFLRFLDACSGAGVVHLFLVGDIFDLWISDRSYFIERYAAAVEKIRALVAAGVQVHYFEGNHDLDLGRFWEDTVGVHVHTEATVFALFDRRVRVEHGDQMDPEDRGYLFLRWLLRTPVLRFCERHLPAFVVKWIGERASRISRDYTSEIKVLSDAAVRGKIRDHALRAHIRSGFDIFISGHVHVAEDVNMGAFRCFNLGTWLKKPLVLELDERGARLLPVEEVLGMGTKP